MYVDEQTYLTHYGIKGMKWGVRKKDSLAVRGVQKIGRTMADSPFGQVGLRAGKRINAANTKRSKRVAEVKTNLLNVKKSAKEVKEIKQSRKAEKKAAKEKEAAIKREANKLTNDYIEKVIEPKLKKKYGGKSVKSLSDNELASYALDFEEMESAFYKKTLADLKKRG